MFLNEAKFSFINKRLMESWVTLRLFCQTINTDEQNDEIPSRQVIGGMNESCTQSSAEKHAPTRVDKRTQLLIYCHGYRLFSCRVVGDLFQGKLAVFQRIWQKKKKKHSWNLRMWWYHICSDWMCTNRGNHITSGCNQVIWSLLKVISHSEYCALRRLLMHCWSHSTEYLSSVSDQN